MDATGTERRRATRQGDGSAIDAPAVRVPLSGSVQVLDISRSGVLLASHQPLPVGRRAQLRVRLGADPVALPIEIRRVQEDRTGGRFKLGASFTALDFEVRARLDRFLRHEV